ETRAQLPYGWHSTSCVRACFQASAFACWAPKRRSICLVASSTSMLEKLTSMQLAIDVRGLTKRFGQRVAIENLSLGVRYGQICGLAGANGGGKSTSLRVLAGLLAADAGNANVLGHTLPGEMGRVRKAVGYLPQRNWLYSTLSVRENLRFRAAVFGM